MIACSFPTSEKRSRCHAMSSAEKRQLHREIDASDLILSISNETDIQQERNGMGNNNYPILWQHLQQSSLDDSARLSLDIIRTVT